MKTIKNVKETRMIKLKNGYNYNLCNIIKENNNRILYYNQLGNYHMVNKSNIKSIISVDEYFKTEEYKILKEEVL